MGDTCSLPSIRYHLAQANVARMRAAIGDPEMAGLASRVGEMNRIAELSPGFVWRLPASQVSAGDLRVFEDYMRPFDAGTIFFNLSVWERVEDLHRYAFASRHRDMVAARHEWIVASNRPQMVMWWVPAGHRPTVAESAERFRALDADGPAAFAFSFKKTFPPPDHV